MMKAGRRELNKIQCRERILDTSRILFTSKGYDKTTIEDIAEAAEISKATLYNYFPGKESLLLGIARSVLDTLKKTIEMELKDEPRSIVKLRRLMEKLSLYSAHNIALTRRIIYYNSRPDSTLYVARLELRELLSALISEAQEQGDLRRDSTVQELTDLFLGVYLLTQLGWPELDSYDDETYFAQVDRVMDEVLEGLGGKHEGSRD